ncbi:MAG: EutP/PduV family microcompartment system protein [Oscillospiraceae bacterium]
MKKIMLIGKQSAGKTTLCQRLNGDNLEYKKTQAIEIVGDTMIDTPGEYVEKNNLIRALMVTSVEADVIIFVIDAREKDSMFSPGLATMFNKYSVGVITKCDTAEKKEIEFSRELLKLASVDEIIEVSLLDNDGINNLKNILM